MTNLKFWPMRVQDWWRLTNHRSWNGRFVHPLWEDVFQRCGRCFRNREIIWNLVLVTIYKKKFDTNSILKRILLDFENLSSRKSCLLYLYSWKMKSLSFGWFVPISICSSYIRKVSTKYINKRAIFSFDWFFFTFRQTQFMFISSLLPCIKWSSATIMSQVSYLL